MRRINMDGYERYWPPIPSASRPDHRGIINEAAFIAFSRIVKLSREEAAEHLRGTLISECFQAAQTNVYGDYHLEMGFIPSDPERREATVIAGRLFNYFEKNTTRENLAVYRDIPGSGIISNCRCDIFDPDSATIYEIKSGDRSFRSVDIRQLLVYCALMFAWDGKTMKQLSVINPRRGVFVESNIDTISMEVSGQSAVNLYQTMIECFSGNLISD